ncbi:hypothetical protein EDD11_000125 [Mortierella claussenii]|nr:hypothetical protein EDD11_000125 [Mortierella claussenii]
MFFSTTARQWTNNNTPSQVGSGPSRAGAAAATAAGTTSTTAATGSEFISESPLGSDPASTSTSAATTPPESTHLDNPPESIACTVSPPSTYAFLKPTPVVLLTGPFGGNWCFRDTWQTTLADQGYQSTSIEFSMPTFPSSASTHGRALKSGTGTAAATAADHDETASAVAHSQHPQLESGDAYIRHFVKVLKTSIETDHSFYPPILIAHGLHALVAQKYVESNPVSALVLVAPFIPHMIKHRFHELSHKLKLEAANPPPPPSPAASSSSSTTSAGQDAVAATETGTTTTAATTTGATEKEGGEASPSTSEAASPSTSEAASPSTSEAASTSASSLSASVPTKSDVPEWTTEFDFKTHADVLAQDGFRERFVLPKKAVYKIDQVAKELQEKEKEKEKEKAKEQQQKEKEVLQINEEASELNKQNHHHQQQQSQDQAIRQLQQQHGATPSATNTPSGNDEVLGKDSIPVWEEITTSTTTSTAESGSPSTSSKDDTHASSSHLGTQQQEEEEEAFPVQTVESEASIPSALEQLPLSIYDSIPTSVFEPTFPILLVTSNGDEIVSTADVKAHHMLAGQVDHIELEDLDDGGHLIMVSDNTEWEEGIQGITAWLDSNGM